MHVDMRIYIFMWVVRHRPPARTVCFKNETYVVSFDDTEEMIVFKIYIYIYSTLLFNINESSRRRLVCVRTYVHHQYCLLPS
jgi:hypothetical protein